MPSVRPEGWCLVTRQVTYKVGLANKIVRGRAVGNLWGVSRYIDGNRNCWVLEPQESEQKARQVCAELSAAG